VAKVKIIIKGIAMSYHKNDGLWKVLFPFGNGHEIKFKENPNDEGISLKEKGRKISITANNASSSFEIGSNYNDFLDLTADYSHSNGIKLKSDWSDATVLTTIENAKFSVDEYTEQDHLLMKDDVVMLEPKRIGYSGKVEIECDQLVINVTNHPDFPKTYESDCVLTFDNDCDQDVRRIGTDLELVYNAVEDAKETKLQFTVIKVPDNLNAPIIRGTPIDSNDKDPFSRLPCHMVRISDSDNLV
jgi:hypothetical protein